MRGSTSLLVLVSLVACSEGSAPAPESLGERLTGAWGQNPQHAVMTTAGLELAGTTLRFGELTITIVQGAMTGPDDYRVDLAEAAWVKDTKPPKKCSGTLARQGNVLLVKLFREGSDTKCESVLDGEWRSWTLGNAVPEALAGVYGSDARDAEADIGLRLGGSTIAFTDGGTEVVLDEVLVSADKPDVVHVRKARFGDVTCSGTITRDEAQMSLMLEPIEGAPAGATCPRGRGTRWTVDRKHLPTAAIANGKVTISAEGDTVTLRSNDGLECKQQVLQTAARSTTGSSWDGIPVTGGAVLVLGAAKPSAGADACVAKLRNLVSELCTNVDDPRCYEARVAVDEAITCPRQIIVGDQVPGGRQAAVLPARVQNLACWDMTGMFVPAK
jgi:hypothetical protein